MFKVEAFIRPERLYDVKQALLGRGQSQFLVSDVRDCGASIRQPAAWRGVEYEVEFVLQVRVELQVADDAIDPVVEAIVWAAFSGKPDDGKIVITPVSEVLDIHEAGRSVERPALRTV